MLTLYTRASCPFCRRVVAVIERLELEVDYKDINENQAFKEELVALGGKQQVPYLIDTDHDVQIYESDDIVAHLQKNYGTSQASAPRIHIAGGTCVSCEG